MLTNADRSAFVAAVGDERTPATAQQLAAAGIDAGRLDALVDAGDVRYGAVTRCYWIAQPADPGALRVMRAAIAAA